MAGKTLNEILDWIIINGDMSLVTKENYKDLLDLCYKKLTESKYKENKMVYMYLGITIRDYVEDNHWEEEEAA